MSQEFHLEYPDGRLQPVMITESARSEYDEANPTLRVGNRHEWAAVITSLDGEPIDLDARFFGAMNGDQGMWPLRGSDGAVRKFLLDQIPSMPNAALVRGSGTPLA